MDLLQNFLISTAIDLGMVLAPVAANVYEKIKPAFEFQVHREDATTKTWIEPAEATDQDNSKVEKVQEPAKQ